MEFLQIYLNTKMARRRTKNKPTTILSPSYCYPESWNLNYTKKLLALDKDHESIRK